MDWNGKETKKEQHQFKSYYCAGCKQRKPCGLLTDWDSDWKSYCCTCYYQDQQAQAQEHNSYEEVLASKQIDRERRLRQLQLLRSYSGCKQCRSREVDAYSLYENNRLICQPCLIGKEGGSSSPISFLEQQKWYKRYWKIDLGEWLEKYQCLPVNSNCAKKWLERHKPSQNQEHLKNCACLEQEAQETYELFANSLKECQEQLEECQCEESEKVRVSSDFYAECEKCETSITVASKKRVIKNRNDPRFWGLNVKERILCGDCLAKLVEQMPTNKKYTFNKYLKRGYWRK